MHKLDCSGETRLVLHVPSSSWAGKRNDYCYCDYFHFWHAKLYQLFLLHTVPSYAWLQMLQLQTKACAWSSSLHLPASVPCFIALPHLQQLLWHLLWPQQMPKQLWSQPALLWVPHGLWWMARGFKWQSWLHHVLWWMPRGFRFHRLFLLLALSL